MKDKIKNFTNSCCSKSVEQMIRVDHAGETGARQIYKGQLAILKNAKYRKEIEHMYEQEQEHLDKFNEIIAQRQVRPSLLLPLWQVGGFGLGVVSGLLGEKAAMACTEAVEEVIDEHYAQQYEQLGEEEKELKAVIKKFREDEIEHKNTAIDCDAKEMKGYGFFKNGVQALSKLAIKVAKVV